MKRIYGDRDIAYQRRIERERISLTGVEATYYRLNRAKNVDPLYNEPCVWDFTKFCVIVAIEYEPRDDRDPSVREEGFEVMEDSRIQISKLEWDENAPQNSAPREGDVIFVHRTYFDIVRMGAGGKVVDLPEFVGYKLEGRRRSKFNPEQRTS